MTLRESTSANSRARWHLTELGQPTLVLQAHHQAAVPVRASNTVDVIYVHGGTFGADLSVFYRFRRPVLGRREPPSVITPFGPIADLAAMWMGRVLYDPALVQAPTLVVRGEWDSMCGDADASRLLSQLGTRDRTDVKIERATHLMHLESQRTLLHHAVNAFLERTMS